MVGFARGTGRHRWPQLVALGALLVLASGLWLGPPAAPSAAPDPATAVTAPTAPAASEQAPDDAAAVSPDIRSDPVPPLAEPAQDEPEPVGDPVRVRVPSIEVDAELVSVGLLEDGAMAVPDFGLAGWYELGPRPGEPGPAVIAAHVDSRRGPDVFFRLDELEPGEEIHVTDVDGEVATFAVSGSELVDKDALPTDRIWNDVDEPVLRLITCGGEFDGAARSYESNVVVYADPVG